MIATLNKNDYPKSRYTLKTKTGKYYNIKLQAYSIPLIISDMHIEKSPHQWPTLIQMILEALKIVYLTIYNVYIKKQSA